MSIGPYDRHSIGLMPLQNAYGPSPAWDENARNRAALARAMENNYRKEKASPRVVPALGKGLTWLGSFITDLGKAVQKAGNRMAVSQPEN